MPGARILLIEDDEVLCSLVKRNLQMRQHEVSIGVDAKSALALLRTHSFDLVLLDINLPDQTGWEILRTARKEDLLQPFTAKEGSGRVLPVVVLSAVRVSPSRLTEFHPLAYLPKPFPMEALLRLAAEAGERREKQGDQGRETEEKLFHTSPEEELHA
jgi:DNA-binding response OmpR family regulator